MTEGTECGGYGSCAVCDEAFELVMTIQQGFAQVPNFLEGFSLLMGSGLAAKAARAASDPREAAVFALVAAVMGAKGTKLLGEIRDAAQKNEEVENGE